MSDRDKHSIGLGERGASVDDETAFSTEIRQQWLFGETQRYNSRLPKRIDQHRVGP
ncbi:MAG: hypothetical protein ACRDXX_13385 [Stackebrandtia sp.]